MENETLAKNLSLDEKTPFYILHHIRSNWLLRKDYLVISDQVLVRAQKLQGHVANKNCAEATHYSRRRSLPQLILLFVFWPSTKIIKH